MSPWGNATRLLQKVDRFVGGAVGRSPIGRVLPTGSPNNAQDFGIEQFPPFFQNGLQLRKDGQPAPDLLVSPVQSDLVSPQRHLNPHRVADLSQITVLRTEQTQDLVGTGERQRGFGHSEFSKTSLEPAPVTN